MRLEKGNRAAASLSAGPKALSGRGAVGGAAGRVRSCHPRSGAQRHTVDRDSAVTDVPRGNPWCPAKAGGHPLTAVEMKFGGSGEDEGRRENRVGQRGHPKRHREGPLTPREGEELGANQNNQVGRKRLGSKWRPLP